MLLVSMETIARNKLDLPMSASDFIANYCSPCGGNWAGMLLTGTKMLFPEVYNEIPEKMGKNGMDAFTNLCETLQELNIDTSR